METLSSSLKTLLFLVFEKWNISMELWTGLRKVTLPNVSVTYRFSSGTSVPTGTLLSFLSNLSLWRILQAFRRIWALVSAPNWSYLLSRRGVHLAPLDPGRRSRQHRVKRCIQVPLLPSLWWSSILTSSPRSPLSPLFPGGPRSPCHR